MALLMVPFIANKCEPSHWLKEVRPVDPLKVPTHGPRESFDQKAMSLATGALSASE